MIILVLRFPFTKQLEIAHIHFLTAPGTKKKRVSIESESIQNAENTDFGVSS